MTDTFELHAQLARDCHLIGDLTLSRVLLMDDVRFPWLILVPRRAGITEIVDLAPEDRAALMDELVAASNALRALFSPDKLNVGALGNRVPQLHVHVVARFASDPAWPGPVWGAGSAIPYAPHQLGILSDQIAKAVGAAPA